MDERKQEVSGAMLVSGRIQIETRKEFQKTDVVPTVNR